MSSFPYANAQKAAAETLNEARELRISVAEAAGVDLVTAKLGLLHAQKVAKAEAHTNKITSAAGQKSYAEDRTIKEQSAVDLAEITVWAAKAALAAIVDRGDDLRSQAATLRKEMDLNRQGGQP